MAKQIRERLVKWMELTGRTVAEVERKSGLKEGRIRKTNSISCETLSLIMKRYPQLSPDYILLNVGEMERNVENIGKLHEKLDSQKLKQYINEIIDEKLEQTQKLEHPLDNQ